MKNLETPSCTISTRDGGQSVSNGNYYGRALLPICLPDVITHDQISQAFPLRICILQAIKYWRWNSLGTRLVIGITLQSLTKNCCSK